MANTGVTVKVKSNLAQTLSEKDKKTLIALNTVGIFMERYAAEACPVDTGRLRASITYATESFGGKGVYSDNNGNVYGDASALATPEKEKVYVGTNVEYAPYVELGSSGRKPKHFLKNSVEKHLDEYKNIIKEELK